MSNKVALEIAVAKQQAEKHLNEFRASVSSLAATMKGSGADIDAALGNVQTSLARTEQSMHRLGTAAGTGTKAANSRLNEVGSCVVDLRNKFDKLTNTIMSAGAVTAGAGLFGNIINNVVDAGLKLEKFQSIFKASTGSGNIGGNELQFIRSEAYRLGLEMNSTTESYARFLGAARNTPLEGKAAREAFVGITEGLAAMKLPAEASTRAFTQLIQMMSKGRLMSEDLVILSESLPGATQMIADALGVTGPKLRDMMEKGEVLAADVLPKLAAAMHSSLGRDAVAAADGAQGSINRFHNALQLTKEQLATDILPGITTGLKTITANINEIKTVGESGFLLLSGVMAGKFAGSIVTTTTNFAAAKTEALATAAALEIEAAAAARAAAASSGLNAGLNANATALAAKATAARANATAMTATAAASRGAGAAMTFLGGPIGVIITLLGVAAAAWNYYMQEKNRALEAKETASANDPANKLAEEIALLREQIRLRKLSKAQIDQEKADAARGQYTSQLAELDKKIAAANNNGRTDSAAAEYRARLAEERAFVAEKLRQYDVLLKAKQKYEDQVEADNKKRAAANAADAKKKPKTRAASTGEYNSVVGEWNSLQQSAISIADMPEYQRELEALDFKFQGFMDKFLALSAKDKAKAARNGITAGSIDSLWSEMEKSIMEKKAWKDAEESDRAERESAQSAKQAAAKVLQEQRTAAELEKQLRLASIETAQAEGAMTATEAQRQKLQVLREITAEQQTMLEGMKRGTAEENIAWNQQAEKVQRARLEVARLQSQLRLREPLEGMKQGLEEYADSAMNLGAQIQSATQNAFKGMEDSLVNFVKTGKLSFSDLANSIISDLIRIAVRASITGPLASALGGFIGGLFSGGGGSVGATYVFHDGGRVSKYHGGGKIVPSFHFGGLASDEVPAVLQTGERVLDREHNALLERFANKADGYGQGVNLKLEIINQTSSEVKGSQGSMRFDGQGWVARMVLKDIDEGGPLAALAGSKGGGW